jgi:DNA-binding transcriptional regulator YiaG
MISTTSLVSAADASAPGLIRTDALGRLHRTPEQREQILDEYERSGLSGPKFAALCGVKYQTLAAWLARRKSCKQAPPPRRRQPKGLPQVRWFEASVQPPAASGAGLLLELPGGVRAQLANPAHAALAAALVRALEKSC